MRSELAPGIVRLAWAEFLADFRWQQGEHVAGIGTTGSGKTTLFNALLDRRRYVVWLQTKPKDKVADGLVRAGWYKAREWPAPVWAERVILWPRIDRRSFRGEQRSVFLHAIDSIYEAGGWCVYADELYYLVRDLGMEQSFNDLWTQGRSLHISLVAGMQRPAWVPLNAYAQSTHLFFFRANDERDLKTIGGIGATDSRVIRSAVARLAGPPDAGFAVDECCEFLYVNSRSARMAVSRVEL